MASTETHHSADHRDLEARVHVDLPRITVDQMTTSQDTQPPPDPTGGRDGETEFMLRHMGF